MLSHSRRPEAEGRRQCGKWYFDLDLDLLLFSQILPS